MDADVTDQPERFDPRSADIAADKREELLRLFPEVRTEADQIDFDQLHRALGETIDPGKERYGLTWPGKANCFRTIQMPSLATLRPTPDESVAWDTTENVIIEGDNLEVLKLLQKSYLGKVKMIYIDPPYNTGNDFIYPDNYTESLKTYLEYTRQVDAEGRKFSTSTDTDGRFHSKWLNMMYPRLYLARNLLREDGVIFISIDDGEVDNLRRLCDEVFGEENRVEIFVWQSIFRPSNMSRTTRTNAEFVLCYTRSSERALQMVERSEKPSGAPSLTQNNNKPRALLFPESYLRVTAPEGRYEPGDYGDVTLLDELVVAGGTNLNAFRLQGRFKWSQAYLDAEVAKGVTILIKTVGLIPYYRKDYQKTSLRPTKLLPRDLVGDVLAANAEIANLLGAAIYSYPKPSSLVSFFASAIATTDDDIVLDFFAGSGTTGHAVLDLNKKDGGNRKFILVQLPEPTDRQDYPTIADITKERVRRVIAKLDAEDHNEAAQDRGFRVFKLDESNIVPWDAGIAHDETTMVEQLQLHVDHIRDDRSPDDILFEVLLKTGFPLSTQTERVELVGTRVVAIADGALLICLSQSLSIELMRAIVERKPERAVFLDEAFANNDALKANAAHLFKAAGITFRTV